MDRLGSIRQSILEAIEPLGAERLPAERAAGRFLASELIARRAAPPHDCSAMDGYAVRAAEAPAQRPLPVAMTLCAGDLPGQPLPSGEAARIFTGAPLPPGADAVVPEELAEEEGGRVVLHRAAVAGANVRRAGEDVAAGAVALPAGVRIGPRQLALCAAVGAEELELVRPPRVALLSTGDELVRGRVADSNGPALAASLAPFGMALTRCTVGDELDDLVRQLERLLALCDAVVTVGGVSVGARDRVRAAVERLGGEVRVHGVPMKPGKPFLFALARGRPVLGLPGSPSACLAAFELFARPALLRMAGAARPMRRRVALPLGERVEGRPGRTRLIWARIGEDGRAWPVGRDAAQVRGPALADALLELPPGAGAIAEGERVEAWLLGA